MKTFAPLDFSLLIAFLLPGSIVLFSLQYVSAGMAIFVDEALSGKVDLGVALFAIFFALAAGVVASAFRAQVLDTLQHKTGVSRPGLRYSKLNEESVLSAFKEALANTYRFAQFYGNMFIALVFLILARFHSPASVVSEPILFSLLLGTLVVLFFSHRTELRNTYSVLEQILRD